MNDVICEALGDTPAAYTPASYVPTTSADPLASAWGRPAYTQPDWWAAVSPPLGTTLSATDSFAATEDYPASKVPVAFGEVQADALVREDRETAAAWTATDTTNRRDMSEHLEDREFRDAGQGRGDGREREKREDSDLVTARATDQSPHLEGRAQPGDIIGVETGGEQTHIGDTSEDEDKRRLDAQRALAKERGRD